MTTHFQSANPVVALANSIVNPVTKLLGWSTRIRKQDVLKGHPITLERNEKISPISVHSVIIARKNS